MDIIIAWIIAIAVGGVVIIGFFIWVAIDEERRKEFYVLGTKQKLLFDYADVVSVI